MKLTFDSAVLKHSFCRNCKCTFGEQRSLYWKMEYLQIKNTQKHSVKLLSDRCIQLTELKIHFDWAVVKHFFCRNCKWTFGALCGLSWKNEYFQIKTTQKHSVKLLSDLCLQLPELNLTFFEQFWNNPPVETECGHSER